MISGAVVFLFPVFLDLAGRACLVAGGGAVGRDKALSLLEAGAAVTVVDPDPAPALLAMASAWPALRVEPRAFDREDCEGSALVFACTGNAAVDAAVLEAAAFHGAPACASGSGVDEGDFSCGAMLRRGQVCVAVSSGGASPTLAALARDRAASVVSQEFGVAAALLARLRDELRREVPDSKARREAMRHAAGAGLVELLEAGHQAEAEAMLADVLAGARAKGQGAAVKEAR